MDAASLEVFCTNIQCGDSEVHADALSQHETRKYRKMSYMGSKEIKTVNVIANKLFNKPDPPQGMYHFYSCPVCGAKRVYSENKGLLAEVDKDTAKLLA